VKPRSTSKPAGVDASASAKTPAIPAKAPAKTTKPAAHEKTAAAPSVPAKPLVIPPPVPGTAITADGTVEASTDVDVTEAAAAPAPMVAPVAVGAPSTAPSAPPAQFMIGDDSAPPLLAPDQKPMTEAEIVLEYQRVGRDIAKLQSDHGTDKVLDLWPRFRAIKLKEQCKTPEGRLDLEGTLKQLRAHIDRRRGITISTECMNNPLAAECQ
jgi:hypothetical protein